jgi:hypothetical protein
MASKSQLTGMQGVYLTAAELTQKDFIVSVTSRSARGVDLFATDQDYSHTWSIQVKASRKAARFWLLHKDYRNEKADQHVYIFVNMHRDQRPDYFVVPSKIVAQRGRSTPPRRTGSVWHAFYLQEAEPYREAWDLLRKPPQSN